MTYLDYLFLIYPVLYIVKVRGESAFTTDKYTSIILYYAVFKRTKSTHCLRLFLPSGLSSPAKGIKCNEMPRALQ